MRVFGSRAVSGGNAAQLLMVAGMLGFQFVGALYLQRALGYPPAATGLAMLPIPVLIAVVSLGLAGRLVARFGARRVLLGGQLLLVLGLLLLTRAPTGSYLRDLLPAFAVLGLGAGLALPAVTTVIMSEAGPDDAGLVSGLADTSQQVGGALGVAVLAALAAARTAGRGGRRGGPRRRPSVQGFQLAFGAAPRWSPRPPLVTRRRAAGWPRVSGRTGLIAGCSDDAEPATGPLAGLLVADFSRILAGPYATMLLADLGATVIKVEGPGAGDDTRTWSPPTAPDGTASYYLSINRNKRSIVLDLTDAGDVELARRLAARADVLVENFKPGGLRRFGLDHETVAAANPAIIYCSISGFGAVPAEEGGGAALPGYDLLVQAVSGLMSLTGDPAGPPYRAGVAVFDVITGLHAAVAVLAALQHRERTGQGQLVRDQPALRGAVRAGQPDLRGTDRGSGAEPAGQRPPEPVPVRAAAHR